MSAYLAKVSRGGKVGLIPTDEVMQSRLEKMEDGECLLAEIVYPRSVSWHRMYFGICSEIGKNQDPARDEDSIDRELRILSGHYDVMHVGGYEVRIPKRIAFHKMSADEWADYWRRVEVAIAERFGEGYLSEIAA